MYVLIQKGCKLALQDISGHTPYDLCVLYGEAEAKGAIAAAGMIQKHTLEMSDKEKVTGDMPARAQICITTVMDIQVARKQRDATQRALQRLQQELKHVKV